MNSYKARGALAGGTWARQEAVDMVIPRKQAKVRVFVAWETLECGEDLAVAAGFLKAGPAPSRVNPLPQDLHGPQG
ncbi:hypothetical protein PPUN109347_10470 [Pseudomonas putida]|nr:hypothetical protein PPUN109347_10470 [Pseudomonas putida]